MAMLFRKVEEPTRGALLEEAEHWRWTFKVYSWAPLPAHSLLPDFHSVLPTASCFCCRDELHLPGTVSQTHKEGTMWKVRKTLRYVLFQLFSIWKYLKVWMKKAEENTYKLGTNANRVYWLSAKRREEREQEKCLAVATTGEIDLQYSHQHPNHISYQYLEALR